MIKNLDVVLRDLEGKEIIDSEDTKRPVLARTIIINALMATYKDENPSGEEKVRRYKLAMLLHGGSHELSAEDIVLIKTLVGKGWGPIIVGQIYDLLESN